MHIFCLLKILNLLRANNSALNSYKIWLIKYVTNVFPALVTRRASYLPLLFQLYDYNHHMKILLLSAYDAQSHRYWRNNLSSLIDDVNWKVLTLPARHFNWRIRGNALSWGAAPSDIFDQKFDLCVATSMVDLATIRGLIPALTDIPTLLYFHENQFSYPVAKGFEARQLEPQMVQLYGALSADKLAFNSQYNLTSFFEGIDTLLRRFPDQVPAGIVSGLRQKSVVLPVPVSLPKKTGTPLVKNSFVWNHRWEYDKSPDRLLAFLKALPPELALTFHIVGQAFRQVPKEFEQIKSYLAERQWLGEWGYIDCINIYHNLLEKSQYVISTAEHDFQGIAVLEAIAAGCVPVLPDRVAYQGMFPEVYRYKTDPNLEVEAKHMVSKVLSMMNDNEIAAPDIQPYIGANIAEHYREIFSGMKA